MSTESGDGSERKFSMCVDLKFSWGFTHPGVTAAWFSDEVSAREYLNQNTVEIERVYINELKPLE